MVVGIDPDIATRTEFHKRQERPNNDPNVSRCIQSEDRSQPMVTSVTMTAEDRTVVSGVVTRFANIAAAVL